MSGADQKIAQYEKDIEALQKNLQELKAQKEQEGKYQFQRGDVVKMDNLYRLICESENGQLFSVDESGYVCCRGQENFDYYRYKKIGKLSSFNHKED